MYPVERRVPGASPRPYTGVDTVFSVCPPMSANGMDRLHPHSTPTEMRLQAPSQAQVRFHALALFHLIRQFACPLAYPLFQFVAGSSYFVFRLYLPRDFGGSAAIPQKFTVLAEMGPAGKAGIITPAMVWPAVTTGIGQDEVAERAVRSQFVEMFLLCLGRHSINGCFVDSLLSGLAKVVRSRPPRCLAIAIRHISEPQVLIQFPKPVGRRFRQISEPFFAFQQDVFGALDLRDVGAND